MIEGGPLEVKLDPSRYVVEAKLAQGGMGTIYRVLDRSLGRSVAMKVCTQSSVERFRAEAQVTAQLNHPGIVPVHEVGVADAELAYFTMPLVDGKSLSEVHALARAGRDGWNPSRAVAVLIKVCQAVAYAHTRGIVHRDLKPDNVMVGTFGQVYVLDWGLAREVSALNVDAEEGDLISGTPPYMAPEQAAGAREAIGAWTDVYALGALLYELLSGRPPYLPGQSLVDPRALLARVREGPPAAVATLDPQAPRELIAICERAMEREPGSRYASALELAEDLQAYLDHRVVTAYRTGRVAELRSWGYRHRALLAAVVAVAMASLVGYLALDWYLSHAEARRLIAGAQLDVARHHALRAQIAQLQRTWLESRASQDESAEAWLRAEEISKYRALQAARQELISSFTEAELKLSSALDLAPPASVRQLAEVQLTELYLNRRQAILDGEVFALTAEHFESQIRALNPRVSQDLFQPLHQLSVASEPPGADVYCFRYEEGEDTRLEPRAFDAASGQVLGEPYLQVESIWNAEKHQGVFAVGDRLLTVRGQTVRTRRELARALEGLRSDEAVPVEVERLGGRVELRWVPFPGKPATSLAPGALVTIPLQLGLSFAGYPLEFSARCHLGVTGAGSPLVARLPRGSYLLVLRKSGHHVTRFPVVIPWREGIETIRLPLLTDLPNDFVPIPAGPFTAGGDGEAFQSLDRREVELPDFAMGRHEVSVAEYLEYLCSPEVLARTDENGLTTPQAEDVREELLVLGRKDGKLLIVPASGSGKLLFEKGTGTWAAAADQEAAGRLRPRSPVYGVSQLAAREYAHWRTRREQGWIYRLPDDLEWEKAARGVDRRTHVWGEYLIWTFCWSAKHLGTLRPPTATGAISTDESVYGVRDLAGSVDEHTSSRFSQTSATRRGSSWSVSDTQNLRIANRNSRRTDGQGTDTGFRLVAVPRR